MRAQRPKPPRTSTRALSKPLRDRSEARRLQPGTDLRQPKSSQGFGPLRSAKFDRRRPRELARHSPTLVRPQRRRGEPVASDQPLSPKALRLYMAAPFGHNRRALRQAGPRRFREFRHGSQLGAHCLGRDHRRSHDLRRRLSGERRVRASGAGFVHHRARLAFAVLVAGSDAGAARARHHDDRDRRRLYRLRLARRMGLWPRGRLAARRHRTLPGAIRARDRLARGPRNFRRRAYGASTSTSAGSCIGRARSPAASTRPSPSG